MRSFCDRYFRQERVRPVVRMEFSSNISCYRMAATGMGWTIIPYWTTRMVEPGAEVELFSLGREGQHWDVRVYYRKGAHLGEPELRLMELLKGTFSGESLRGTDQRF